MHVRSKHGRAIRRDRYRLTGKGDLLTKSTFTIVG